jgi:hypothetical protein
LENAPAGHCTHVSALLAPVTFEYAPVGHAMHTLPDKYSPDSQFTLRHTLSALAPTVLDNFPTAQDVHAVVPAALEYVFAGHCTHAPALLAPVTFEYAPGGQLAHTPSALAPTVLDCLPAAQAVHALVPVALAYPPALQFVHTVALFAPTAVEYMPTEQFVQ